MTQEPVVRVSQWGDWRIDEVYWLRIEADWKGWKWYVMVTIGYHETHDAGSPEALRALIEVRIEAALADLADQMGYAGTLHFPGSDEWLDRLWKGDGCRD